MKKRIKKSLDGVIVKRKYTRRVKSDCDVNVLLKAKEFVKEHGIDKARSLLDLLGVLTS